MFGAVRCWGVSLGFWGLGGRREKRTVEEMRGPLDGRVGDDDAVDAFDGVDCIRGVV